MRHRQSGIELRETNQAQVRKMQVRKVSQMSLHSMMDHVSICGHVTGMCIIGEQMK